MFQNTPNFIKYSNFPQISTNTYLDTAHVLAQQGSSNAGVAGHIHVVTEGEHHLLDLLGQLSGGGQDEGLGAAGPGVNALQDADAERGGLASTCRRHFMLTPEYTR